MHLSAFFFVRVRDLRVMFVCLILRQKPPLYIHSLKSRGRWVSARGAHECKEDIISRERGGVEAKCVVQRAVGEEIGIKTQSPSITIASVGDQHGCYQGSEQRP